jgi:flagellar motor switch protein FliN/FliY
MTQSAELITRLGNAQGQIWQAISQSVSDAASIPISFNNPLTVQTQADDLYAEISAPMVVISFAFADQPEHSQILLLNQETFLNFVSVLKNEDVTEVDEGLVTDYRPQLEAIVHGICIAVSNIRSSVVVANGLSVKHQIVSFPPNIQKAEWLGRVQVALSIEELNGTATWLLDPESIEFLVAQDQASPFLQLEAGGDHGHHHGDEPSSLNLIMDVPLEISVELGRVKMMVREVLELGTGAIIEIDKAAGEPVDVMVNGTLVARGEVVVIEDNFGVRITEIVANEKARLGEVA